MSASKSDDKKCRERLQRTFSLEKMTERELNLVRGLEVNKEREEGDTRQITVYIGILNDIKSIIMSIITK